MPQEESEQIDIQVVKGRAGHLDPSNCTVVATIYGDQVSVRIDSNVDPAFWMGFSVPLKGTPAERPSTS